MLSPFGVTVVLYVHNMEFTFKTLTAIYPRTAQNILRRQSNSKLYTRNWRLKHLLLAIDFLKFLSPFALPKAFIFPFALPKRLRGLFVRLKINYTPACICNLTNQNRVNLGKIILLLMRNLGGVPAVFVAWNMATNIQVRHPRKKEKWTRTNEIEFVRLTSTFFQYMLFSFNHFIYTPQI